VNFSVFHSEESFWKVVPKSRTSAAHVGAQLLAKFKLLILKEINYLSTIK
jgi:hypothetical protein